MTERSSPYDYGVYRFRKRLDLPKKPERFVINISADNRYRLLVNGQEACWGPARGDLNRWYYETVDIAPLLRPGQNVLAVTVWNLGTRSPGAQISRQTGLIVQGNSSVEDDVNTDGSWLVLRDESFSPLFNCPEAGYIGGHDRIDGTKYPWGWETVGFDDSKWYAATGFSPGKTYGAPGYGESDWILTPRDIPMMELTEQRLTAVRRQQGLASLPTFIDGRSPLKIPARTKCTVLLDQGFLTTAYPELKVSGGKGSKIKLTYSEALFDERGKGNRNEIDGRECRGFADEFLPDGADGRLFRPLWFKTYRYIQLDIETGAAPLVVEDLYGIYTGYPFEVRGSFESDDPALEKIWETGWRTARLCAHETYFDCPYYEQLQYAGDTRIQALISLYVSGDDRLVRKAIRMYDLSRSYEGITCSRYPSHIPQYIPPFSLYWIGMIHDYWMHRSDDAFVRSFLPGIRTVLSWFTEKIDPHTGLLKNGLPHWNFTDWATSWERGIAPESDSSGSAITTLQLAAALDDAADLMRRYDRPAEAKEYAAISAGLKKNVYEKCWDASKGLLAGLYRQSDLQPARQHHGHPDRRHSAQRPARRIRTDRQRSVAHANHVLLQILFDPRTEKGRSGRPLYRNARAVAADDRHRPHHLRRDPRTNPFGLPCLEFEPELRPAGNGLRRRTRFAGIRYGADRPASGTPETNQRRRTASAGRHHGRTATRRGYIIPDKSLCRGN